MTVVVMVLGIGVMLAVVFGLEEAEQRQLRRLGGGKWRPRPDDGVIIGDGASGGGCDGGGGGGCE